MTAVPVDTLKLAERLQTGGFTPEQAKTAASALAEAISGSELATKQDLELVRQDLEKVRRDLKIWLGSIMIVAVGIILAAIRYLPPHS